MKTIWENYRFSILLIGGMIVGGAAGLIWGPGASVLQPVATIFLNLLFCCVVPLVFCSLVTAIARLSDMSTLRRILIMFFVGTFATGLIACTMMAVSCVFFDPAAGAQIDLSGESELGAGMDIFGMFTVEEFYTLFSKNNLLALIVFSILFAIAIALAGKKGEPVLELMESLSEVVSKLISIIMKAAPVGLGCYFAILMGTQGEQIVGPLFRAVVLYAVVTLVFFVLIQTAYAYIGAGAEGVRRWWKTCLPSVLTSLGTQSSAASIPSNLTQAEQIGIPKIVSDLVIPLGANLHKDGVANVQVLKIAFVCSIMGLNFSDPAMLAMTIGISVIGGMAMGAIPGGGYVAETLIITVFGFPTAAFPVMVMLGTILDPLETMVSVTGDTGLAMVIARLVKGKRWMQEADEERAARASEPADEPAITFAAGTAPEGAATLEPSRA